MIFTSFRNVIRSARISSSGLREVLGGIRDLEEFLSIRSLQKLEARHFGFFCFFAFHPVVDKSIRGYLDSGSVPADSGRHSLCLFFTGTEFPAARVADVSDLDLLLEMRPEQHPGVKLAQEFFPSLPTEKLPGLIFCSSLTSSRTSLFISLAGLDTVELVAHRCRQLFGLARDVSERFEGQPSRLAGEMGVALAKQAIAYENSGDFTFRELLYRAFSIASRNRGDIATAISLF